MSLLPFSDIAAAVKRIQPYTQPTPIMQSRMLNSWFGHEIFFKVECLQRSGAFKFRGAINTLSWLHENGQLPKKVVANSSGNHAQAVALAANLFGIEAQIFTASNVSAVKAAATEYYGADLVICDTRIEADQQVQQAAEEDDVFWIPPFDHPQVIAGQGTVAYEALQQVEDVDAIFAPCGGGGLLSGTLIAARELAPNAVVIGSEPLIANDAVQSLRQGSIQRLPSSPATLADGAATLAISELTFAHLQHIDDFYEVDEAQIAYWTQWLQHLLKIHVEPTSAMSMAAVAAWSQTQDTAKRIVVILSGGNIDSTKMQAIWQTDYLQQMPILVE
ncbi:serine/threonine dehydratase [Alteromonadaceae bacterium BrNp21-10]|nr:serine/threonine dehydratase [Alteromonadaceae bacterium BrNp21-10]